jgi:hypothetical protein
MGRPVFLLADAAFWLVRRLRREDVAMYLRTRREQGFNAVARVAVGGESDLSEGSSDAYGHPAFTMASGGPASSATAPDKPKPGTLQGIEVHVRLSFQDIFNARGFAADGSPVLLSRYATGFAGIWEQGVNVPWQARHGLTSEQSQETSMT